MRKPKPTQSESLFRFDEFFFSTTDHRGVILNGNEVFVRISGYSKETLIGAPHSIIRHPDMPRAVFKLLWDTIKAGAPIAAYVKNMSANGNFYWVLAFVFPIEGGYLSIRFKPSSALFQAVQNIYHLTLEVEEKEGLEGSVPFILDQVQKAGFENYTDFMVQAAFAELNQLAEKNKGLRQAAGASTLAKITEISTAASGSLKDCFQRIQEFQKINQSFCTKMKAVNEGFQHLKFNALNMTIASVKFGEAASGLSVVAKEFSDLSTQIQSYLSGLSDLVTTLSSVIQKCSLRIAALETQMLMVDFFIRESIQKSAHSEDAFAEMVQVRPHFSRLFHEYASALETEVSSMTGQLVSISDQMNNVRKFTTGLEVIRQIGSVESARTNETKQTFAHYLSEMLKFITLLQTSSSSIQKDSEALERSSKVIAATAAHLAGQVDSIFDLTAAYSPADETAPRQNEAGNGL